MGTVTLRGNATQIVDGFPAVGSQAPDFHLVTKTLRDVHLSDYAGKKKLLSAVPSLDTGVCIASTKRFYEAAAGLDNVVLLVVSDDLPFAATRVCADEEIDKVETLSMMRSRSFAKDYGLLIEDGPLAGLCTRAVIVIDENDKIIYTELVPEISQEPDYDKALAALA